jgi:hypothetical protein
MHLEEGEGQIKEIVIIIVSYEKVTVKNQVEELLQEIPEAQIAPFLVKKEIEIEDSTLPLGIVPVNLGNSISTIL